MTPKLRRFLDQVRPSTPYLVVDVDIVEANYLALAAALDGVRIFYAVKANPAPEILSRLAALGCSFDVASPAEVDDGPGGRRRPEPDLLRQHDQEGGRHRRAPSRWACACSPSTARPSWPRSPAPRRAAACSAAS